MIEEDINYLKREVRYLRTANIIIAISEIIVLIYLIVWG